MLPTHIGIIMDGNGRWAKKRLLPRSAGHREGMKQMIALSRHVAKLGIPYMTVYALSTENLGRPKEEVEGLYQLIRKYFTSNFEEMLQAGSAVRILGDMSDLPQDIAELLQSCEQRSPKNAPFTLSFALNYGSRREVCQAVNRAVKEGKEVTEQTFGELLYTHDLPDPDLIIRTGGEKRLSNFLMYQAAYAELYFCDTLFPDFNEKEMDLAIQDYQKRSRRFGKV